MQQTMLSFADFVVSSPLVRWTWSGLAEQNFPEALGEFRPSDIETVREMMAGRYLLASKLIDTQNTSPFVVEAPTTDWYQELHKFSWLRHFGDARDESQRRFARTLVLDWIGRNTRFDARSWALVPTSVRVLNWLRHLPLLIENAAPEQAKAITRSLGTQLQSLKLRGGLTQNPNAALYAAMAMMGAALCDGSSKKTHANRLMRLETLLDMQIDADGMHLSRDPNVQFELLIELASVRQALSKRYSGPQESFAKKIDLMHRALDILTLGTGEPAYFNGCGQLPVDLIIAVQAQSVMRRSGSTAMGGYGLLINDASTIVADSGRVPPPAFARKAHASALAFEFSHGNDLVICNCGPAPADMADQEDLFRLGAAHSGPSINNLSSAEIVDDGSHTDILRQYSPTTQFSPTTDVRIDTDEASMVLQSSAFVGRTNIKLERQLTLIAEGQTLVGQDRIFGVSSPANCELTLRFHLAPGAVAMQTQDEDVIHIKLNSGAAWTFLWEGATANLDESLRQSTHFGFFRTKQIVITTRIVADSEISWIFTRDNG